MFGTPELEYSDICPSWECLEVFFHWQKFEFRKANPLRMLCAVSSERCRQEDIIKEVKRHSFYLKPGEKKRVKEALARKRNRKKVRKEQD